MTEPILRVKDLQTSFFTEKGEAKVLDGVSFSMQPGEILGLVGETGSGKSVTGFSLMSLVKKPGRVTGGEVWLDQVNILGLSDARMEKEIRGGKISMIFQNPRNSLNPLITTGDFLIQVIRIHQNLSQNEAYAKAVDLLRTVHIPSPEERMKAYPHQLSGGMAQRIMIALAISCNPSLLIADEPTTGLDVTTQAQILHLLKEVNTLNQSSQLFITHDLGAAANHCDRIAVMYAGSLVEENTTSNILYAPLHPYTRGLVSSRPHRNSGQFLVSIPGSVPNPHRPPAGCRFHPRCPWATERCKTEKPPLEDVELGRVACWNWKEAQKQDVNRFGSSSSSETLPDTRTRNTQGGKRG